MKKIDIKGKDYVPVNERIIYFRTNEDYKGWSFLTEIIALDEKTVTMKTTVYDDKREERSNGYAQEKEGSTFINKTSHIENCETSSVGRALGNLGIGVDTSVASFEEVANAITQQKTQKKQGLKITLPQKDKIIKLVQAEKIDLVKVLEYYKVKSIDGLNHIQAQQVIDKGAKKL